MKRDVLLLTFLLTLPYCASTTVQSTPTETIQDDNSITYQNFYDELSPYGSWIDYPGYGNVWSPRLEAGFRPYATNGHWEYSNEGWMWASSYNWGWAPFHYGRWLYDDNYGWLWMPGYEWSPAWVTWGYADDYYCWAPLMPGVDARAAYGSWQPHPYYWNVCGRDHIYDSNIPLQRPEQVNAIAPRIAIMNNFSNTRTHNLYYAQGPRLDEVERFTNKRITQVSIRDTRTMGQARRTGSDMQVYRPVVQNPQPRSFRQADGNARPIVRTEDRPVQQSSHVQNVERLPVRQAPPAMYNRGPRKQ
jgi:hypothetical protein